VFKRVRSEIELIQASQRGDTQAFEVIVRQYQSLVCAITYSGTGCMHASEELAQETLLLAWQNLKQLREPGKFQAWLCRIARNTVQDWRRKRGRHNVEQSGSLALAEDQASETAEPVDTAIKQEQAIVVSRALDQIPEKYREPLILYYREEKSVREVAGLLSLTENTTRQRITRAQRCEGFMSGQHRSISKGIVGFRAYGRTSLHYEL
jgi:RNA polymerase sigma factor (sigma-70 family)